MFIYIVVRCELLDDYEYRTYDLCVFDSKEKAIEFIERYYGNVYIRADKSDYWLRNGNVDDDRVYIETWGVR